MGLSLGTASKDSTIFYYKNGTAFNIQENQSSLSRILLFQPIFCPNETAFISKFKIYDF